MTEPNNSTSQNPPALPIVIPRQYDRKRVEKDFWPKLKRIAGKIPGVSDILALYFYMNSDLAPVQHKVSVMATLAYFIIPFDLIPDFLGVIGYADDLAVAMGLIKFIGADVMRPYRVYARKWLAGETSAAAENVAHTPPPKPGKASF